MLMIAPRRASIITFEACFANRNAPVRFTSSVSRHASAEISTPGAVGPPMPALLTSTSSRPVRVTASRTAAATAASSATLSTATIGSVSSARSSAATEARLAWLRDATITLAPSRPKARAMARPMPTPPPVTITVQLRKRMHEPPGKCAGCHSARLRAALPPHGPLRYSPLTMPFKLHAPYEPRGDQPQAISELVAGLRAGDRYQTLLGATGSGKTFSISNVIAEYGRPTLVISHNKTLAAQLYGEFRQFFPENAVGYFISYYDYYQPEAYVPQTNTYIAKDASINDDIDRLRLQATSMLLERENVVIVSSVSCLYGLGTPEDWRGMRIDIRSGAALRRRELLDPLVALPYTQHDLEVGRGHFRVRGDVV